jgi:hypothetical protein
MKGSGLLEPLICNMVAFHFCVNFQVKVYTTLHFQTSSGQNNKCNYFNFKDKLCHNMYVL